MKNSKLKWLVTGSILNNAGVSFIWPLNTIYMHDHLGKSLSAAGFVLLLNSITTLVGNFAGGRLFDRIGGYKTILIGLLTSIVSLIGLVMYHGWPAYAVLLVVLGLGTGIVVISINSFAASMSGYEHRYVFNSIYLGLNVGVAVGTSIAGFIADINITLIFTANLLLYIAFLAIVLFFYKDLAVVHHPDHPEETKRIKTGRRSQKQFINVLVICALYLVIWIGYVQWQSNVSARLPELHISMKQYSFLWTINAVLIVIGQPLISQIIKKAARTYKVQINIGVISFILSFVVLMFSVQYAGFLVAIVLLTFGEMFAFPAIPAMISTIAPTGQKGACQSFVNMSSTIGRAIGPVIGGIIVERSSYTYLYIVIIILMGLSILIFHYLLKHMSSY
ncbi:MFS transporter [Sporolactobacillus shoreae]|uniref:MFS transporter n=1 Tax=Sporolactobacillus shoreae TaxID=1465501 RepID=A0A4Z0GP81_9BACL|nr:MFS transporter [Sporolactobacillus shoreae]TGA98983.1 MFS transporter [Sporolactobacillus shoreae]